jgi:RNA polymerase sigma-70 factor (ECF subfamily)
LKFESFNEDYVRRLTDGDSAAGEHFAAYFERVLFLKLRVRLSSFESIEDVLQETLLRVLLILRQRSGVNRPERFGAFVNGVCDHVMQEFRRMDECTEFWDETNMEEPIDPTVDTDARLVDAESKRVIQQVFAVLPARDRRILQALYLDEMDRAEVCRLLQVDGDYLRVLLKRAKTHFRDVLDRQAGCRGNSPRRVNPDGGSQSPGLQRTGLRPRAPLSRRS